MFDRKKLQFSYQCLVIFIDRNFLVYRHSYFVANFPITSLKLRRESPPVICLKNLSLKKTYRQSTIMYSEISLLLLQRFVSKPCTSLAAWSMNNKLKRRAKLLNYYQSLNSAARSWNQRSRCRAVPDNVRISEGSRSHIRSTIDVPAPWRHRFPSAFSLHDDVRISINRPLFRSILLYLRPSCNCRPGALHFLIDSAWPTIYVTGCIRFRR